MKILTIHNRYKYRGGEDESRESEDALLAEKGHEIRTIIFDNASITRSNSLKVGLEATWSRHSYAILRDYIQSWRPDLLDVHNFFPLASPSIYYAARAEGIPVVQTLHNYRLLCPAAIFYRDGHVCEDCTKNLVPWPAIVHKCYRGSALQSAAVGIMTSTHRLLGTWRRMVNMFITVSAFEKQKFVESGFPESRIVVKPNFVFDPGTGAGGTDFVFVGRLTRDKGVLTLLEALRLIESRDIRLRIVGDGPLQDIVRDAAAKDTRLVWHGRLPQSETLAIMASARCVIVPSEWYETFGRTAAEAFSVGTPVICSNFGAMAEMVEDGRTGFYFQPGNARQLADLIGGICGQPSIIDSMRGAARGRYEAFYTPARNYEMMMAIYHSVLAKSSAESVRS